MTLDRRGHPERPLLCLAHLVRVGQQDLRGHRVQAAVAEVAPAKARLLDMSLAFSSSTPQEVK